MDAAEHCLLNGFQRDFPLCEAPYAAVAAALHATEHWVLAALRRAMDEGVVSRIGPVFRPGSAGASTLAAIGVPPSRLEEVARSVSAHRGINHNYEREHRLNLWFVANAADPGRLEALIARIQREIALPVVVLPLEREYHIDLGFDLDGVHARVVRAAVGVAPPGLPLDVEGLRIAAALQEGLPLSRRPYKAIALRAGLAGDEGEQRVLRRLRAWLDDGVVRRLGVIVRHRALGYVANVMAVWDIPDEDVDAVGVDLARERGVTLCYRRARGRPAWPYNLFCMLHGSDRGRVEAELDAISARRGLAGFPQARLFSRRAFKQGGARHFDEATLHG
ncbi:MAG: Lrp/AsnC family transcriptional regulator [Betaproteobacteria bacterium]|nr:Lrp/AsnC family transcriptional regulator [Betaproteobacteria bacterium]